MTSAKLFRIRQIIAVALFASFTSVAFSQSDPSKSFETRVNEASALYKAGNMPESVTAFEKLHKENARSTDVQAWLGFLYLRTNRNSEAVPLLESAALSRKYDLEVQNNLGNAYLATGQDVKALAIYDQIRRQDPKMFEPLYNSGVILIRQKNFRLAADRLTAAVALKPDDPFVRNNLGIAFENLNELPRAATSFATASDLRPTNEVFARNAGMMFSRLRRTDDTINYLTRAVKLSPKVPDLRISLAEVLSQKGDSLSAIDNLEIAVQLDRKNSVAWFNLGVLKEQRGDDKGAAIAYQQGLEVNPTDLDTLNNFGLMQMRREDWNSAYTTFSKLAGLNPFSLDTQQNLGVCAARTGDYKTAVEAWKKVVRLDGTRTAVRLDLANALWLTGDFEGAFYHFKQVVAKNPKSAEAYNGIGLCWMQKEQLAQAEAAFRSAIDSKRTFVPGHNNLALVLEKMGQRQKAIKVLEDGLKAVPDDPTLRQSLVRMRNAD